jgi:hypothetical protein
MSQLPSNYLNVLSLLKEKIRQVRVKAALQLITQHLIAYWELIILQQVVAKLIVSKKPL